MDYRNQQYRITVTTDTNNYIYEKVWNWKLFVFGSIIIQYLFIGTGLNYVQAGAWFYFSKQSNQSFKEIEWKKNDAASQHIRASLHLYYFKCE